MLMQEGGSEVCLAYVRVDADRYRYHMYGQRELIAVDSTMYSTGVAWANV
jgi:hypothetical protein